MAKEKNIKVAQMDETRNGHTVSVLRIGRSGDWFYRTGWHAVCRLCCRF